MQEDGILYFGYLRLTKERVGRFCYDFSVIIGWKQLVQSRILRKNSETNLYSPPNSGYVVYMTYSIKW